jgi:heme-degrading monooxygenase HmoA
MKTILMVFALALAMSVAGSASNVSSVVKGQTESASVSKMNSSSSMKAGKSKKAHHKKHKRGSGSKKTK